MHYTITKQTQRTVSAKAKNKHANNNLNANYKPTKHVKRKTQQETTKSQNQTQTTKQLNHNPLETFS